MRLGGTVSVPVPQAVWLEGGQAAAGPTIENNPPSVDESMHKVSRTNPDGTIETLYQCEHCQKTFLTSASITCHRLQHTEPFQCEQCKQRFASKGNPVIHRRRHTGEKTLWLSLV